MANLDDVIELGSSDEDTEPAPKKKRPMPMVHIPGKLPGVTIKPTTKQKINPVSIANGKIGKAVTVTKLPNSGKLSNPFARKIAQNGNSVGRKQSAQMTQSVVNPAMKILPPLKNLTQIQPMPVGKVPKAPIKIIKLAHAGPHVLQPQPVKRSMPGSLPSGITVKRTTQLQSGSIRNMKPIPANAVKKRVVRPARKHPAEMVCVDLDDDDAAPNPVGPQWYLRPEEEEKKNVKTTESPKKSTSLVKPTEKATNEMETTEEGKEATDLEKINNMEPDTPKYIEITIEDSPAKPQPKRTCEVADQAITIDDSPVKAATEKPTPSGSDEETTTTIEKHSKKKLEYPKASTEHKTVEIEIECTPLRNDNIQSVTAMEVVEKEEPECTPVQNDDIQNNAKTQESVTAMEVVEIEESPLKPDESLQTSTPKKKALPKPLKTNVNNLTCDTKSKQNVNRPESVPKPQGKLNKTVPPTKPGEFHPVFQNFIDLCFQLENSEDMNKIVERKIKVFYRKAPKEYTESEMFIDMVSSKIMAMKADSGKMYLYIKDVVDELGLQRKIAALEASKAVNANEEQDKYLYGEDSEFDSKRQRQIRMLEKTLKKLHRAIQKLEEQEVDFDDEEDSVYLLTERYKERMIRVHAKLCQLTNTKMPSEPRIQIDGRPGQPKGPAKRLEKWINKKVPIGTPLPFPDFHDVLRCVRDANQEDKLCWNEADIMEEARDLFTRCGKKLQRRRQENEWRSAASRIQSEVDPAEENVDLKKALDDNKRVAFKRESEVFNKYADRQNQLNLEAVEIGDKEAEESPMETDDEEPSEENISLTKKRKDGLKKLLQKKSKKDSDEKDPSETKMSENDRTEVEKAKETDNKKSNSKGDKIDENKETSLLDKGTDPSSSKQNDTEKDPLSGEKICDSDVEKIHSLSDDSNKIDSDIDELHLLQKLHSDVFESSDSESPIAISDTLSSDDNEKQASDVISIENSSYSESEKNNEQDYEKVSYSQKKVVTECVNTLVEIECSDAGVERIINKSNNDEYTESVENILLASSDDEANNEKNDPISTDETNIKQLTDENTTDVNKLNSNANADTTDATSMESIEITSIKNRIPLESSEVCSIPSSENSSDDSNTPAAEVTNINSIEMVVDDIMTSLVDENAQTDLLTSVKSVATAEDTGNKSTENDKDETMTLPKPVAMTEDTGNKSTENDKDETMTLPKSVATAEDTGNKSTENDKDETMTLPKSVATAEDTGNKSTENDKDETMTLPEKNTKTGDEENIVDSAKAKVSSDVENKNSKVSIKLKESAEDIITTEKSDVDTSKVNIEVKATETAVVEQGSNDTEMNTD